MTKRGLFVSFFLRKARAKFLLSVRCVARKFLAFFRGFTEEDACALLSAYGLYGLEIARLQDDRPDTVKPRTSMIRGIEGSSSLSPRLGREPMTAPPVQKLWWTGRPKEADQSSKDSADLDTAFAEIVEAIDLDWPESLAMVRIRMGIAEIVVFAGLVVLARRAAFTFYPKRPRKRMS